MPCFAALEFYLLVWKPDYSWWKWPKRRINHQLNRIHGLSFSSPLLHSTYFPVSSFAWPLSDLPPPCTMIVFFFFVLCQSHTYLFSFSLQAFQILLLCLLFSFNRLLHLFTKSREIGYCWRKTLWTVIENSATASLSRSPLLFNSYKKNNVFL